MAQAPVITDESTPVERSQKLWQLRLYKHSLSTMSRLYMGLEACLHGFWLGVLRRESLEAIDELYYSEKENYFSAEYNRQGLARWEQRVIDKYFGGRQELLLIAAGGGREVFPLLRMGFSVDAYECHPGLKDFANQLLQADGFEAAVSIAPRDQCPAGIKTYQGVIVGWGAYMHIQPREKRIELLKQIRERLDRDGRVLLSFWHRSGKGSRFRIIAGVANCIRFVLRRERLEIGDDLNINFVHYFTKDEVRAEMEMAGFSLLYYSSKPYGHAVGSISEKSHTQGTPADPSSTQH